VPRLRASRLDRLRPFVDIRCHPGGGEGGASAAGTIRAAAAAGAVHGLSRERLERALRASGLAEADLRDPDRLLDLDSVLRLADRAARSAEDDCFGLHVGEAWDLGDLGVLSYAVLNAPTVRTGLRNLDRYGRVHVQGGRILLTERADEAQLEYQLDTDDRELARQHVESAAVVGLRIVRRLAGERWRPRRVSFGHSRPRDCAEHARIFDCELRFGEHDLLRMVFDSELLALPVAGADRRLLPLVEQHLDELVARPAEAGVVVEVRSVLARTLCDGSPTIRNVARQCGMSVRTLQRRLDAEGVAFRDLVQDTRRELAERYLAEPGARLTEIAFMLGYSELSAFGRAFRRWTGTTPLATRKRLLERARAGGPADPPP
jgi:AraC-like DNA-binding protein